MRVVNRLKSLCKKTSFPCQKGGGNVIDPLVRHFDHIEAHIDVPARAHEKIARNVDVPFPLMALHRLRGSAELRASPRLYLAENHRVLIERDDIRLPVCGAVISL